MCCRDRKPARAVGREKKDDLFEFTLSPFSFSLRLFSFKDAELVQYENVAAFDTLVLLRKREVVISSLSVVQKESVLKLSCLWPHPALTCPGEEREVHEASASS